jgi:hypothetical protein
MKKRTVVILSMFALAGLLAGCGTTSTPSSSSGASSSQTTENFYSINTDKIRTEMLLGTTQTLEISFTNLGEAASPKYKMEITLDGADVTATVYQETSKLFSPKAVGSYSLKISVLNDAGTLYTTAKGESFTKTITIDVVTQSFAPRDTAGKDVSVSSDGVITFGDSYSAGSADKLDSYQYKVTGVTFEGSYSITYEMSNLKIDPTYSDPSLYFGWVKNWKENNDDSLKLDAKGGKMSAWIWGKDGDLADLSVNRAQGWSKGGWWDAPGSVNGNSPITGDHTITFERYVNADKQTAIYGIRFDNNPFTYLNLGSAYTDTLTNVWVESNNVSGSIKVKEYKAISDTQAPTLALAYNEKYQVGDTVNLKGGATITDDSPYQSLLVPSFKVYDSANTECEVNNGTFTPTAKGTYTVKGTVSDLASNEASAEATLLFEEAAVDKTVIDLSETSPVAMPNSGIVIYYTAKLSGNPVEVASIKVMQGDTDVTATTLFHHHSTTTDMDYLYFKAPAGNYSLVVTAQDGESRSKDISVALTNTVVYGFTYYDLGSLVYEDKFIVGKDTIIYTNNGATDKQTVKLGFGLKPAAYNWTIEYDITDLAYTAQGKFFTTKNTLKADGSSAGWEDLAVGGNCKSDGSPDLWGYECNVVGTGWVSYEWRSVWQNKTTEFMPDPTDATKGCGRTADQYTQYATGTHHYKIACTMDDANNVTYSYFIDGAAEVVHHTADDHDGANGVDFVQFSGEHMNGIVSNIKVA